jgi:hypothetical protein
MRITVIKEGNTLRVLSASEELPEGTELTLFTETGLAQLRQQREAWMTAQMPSFLRGDETERAEELF